MIFALLAQLGMLFAFGSPVLAATENMSFPEGDCYPARVVDGEDKAEAVANSKQDKEESQSNQLL